MHKGMDDVTDPGTDDPELTALVGLCTLLPELQHEADRQGWRPKLDNVVAGVRNGQSALRAWRHLGLPDDPAQLRSAVTDPIALSGLGIDPVPVTGDYVCPHYRCTRQAQADPAGQVPQCVDGRPMRLTPRS